MGEFLKEEKILQTQWKKKPDSLSTKAQKDGKFKNGISYPFIIPAEHSAENLSPEIREKSIAYFKNHGIPWHDNNGDFPGAHLCDSQVCCVNFLMPLANSEALILDLFKRYFPDISKVLHLDKDSLIAFEWIGEKNYLKELQKANTKRTRGALCTSVDAAVMFECNSGKKIIVLIEWKYTETYTGKSLKFAKSGRDRTSIYQHLWDKENCPINKEKVGSFDYLFVEPFYQFCRQQFLANEMELAQEAAADEVYLMHISPNANKDFKTITSKQLKSAGTTATDAWKNILKNPSKFIPLHTEDFFDKKIILQQQNTLPYWNYISKRYPSLLCL